jgi:hypothetical protein
MHKSATKCNETLGKWCKNKHGASKIIDTLETYHDPHPFKIPMKIVERAMNNCYLGDGTVHPSDHLLFIRELCELFKCAGISPSQVKRKLFSLSLKGGASEWYNTLKNGRSIWLGGNCTSLLF